MIAPIGTRAKLVAAAAAAAVSGLVCAQPALPRATTDTQAALVEEIARLRAADGPNAAGAIEPLRALALQYQEAGDDALAVVMLEDARHVTRVNQGLTSADEALLMRQQVRSEKALGAHDRAWDLEQEMVTIARQHHDDIRMAQIFRGLAEDRADVLKQYRGGHLPPEIYLGCYYANAPRPYGDTRGRHGPAPGMDGSCRSGNKLTAYRQLRTEILMYYADAIEVIVKDRDFASQELRSLERAAVRFWTFPSARRTGPVEMGVPPATVNGCEDRPLDRLLESELLGTCLDPILRDGNSVAPNVGGWVSLVRLIAYEVRSGSPPVERAKAIVDFADWHLHGTPAERRRFNSDEALGLYERAYRELQQGADVPVATRQLFSPELPITLLTFEPNPFAASKESQRYIDVAFAITKYGRAEQIEILDTSKDPTRGELRDLTRLIELSSFRPRVVDGVLAAAAPVTIRYPLAP